VNMFPYLEWNVLRKTTIRIDLAVGGITYYELPFKYFDRRHLKY